METKKIKLSREDKIFETLLMFFSIVLLFIVLYPIYFILVASISDPSAVANRQTLLLPKGLTLDGYKEVFKNSDIWIGYRNTILYTVSGTIIALVVNIPAGYVLSRDDLVGRPFITWFYMLTMFIGGGLIPTFLTMQELGLYDNPLVMVLPFSVSVYNIIVARSFFKSSLPADLWERARLDGCGNIMFSVRIAVPLSKAIMLLFSRSSYIGMHRYGGIWTGDNGAWWPHLLLNIQMMPSLNMCGFLYAGADLGGFGGDTTRDLLLRWLAFGVFTPLMRNHSSCDTREQECYQFEHPEDFAHVIGVRYRLLPYLYSEYVKAALTDEMYFRPLAFDYPDDPLAKEIEDQLMLGDGVMVVPVYRQNATGRYVYLPEDMLFVKFQADGSLFQENMEKGIHWISVALNEVPMFVKKNRIVPLADFAETVCSLNEEDLTIIGWITEPASYTLYQDDGYAKNYEHSSHYRTIKKLPG